MAQRFCPAHHPAPHRARVALLVLAIAVSGVQCASQPELKPLLTRQAVAVAELARWETAHGPLPRCRAELVSLRWDVQPTDVLGRLCCTSLQLTGCFSYDPGPPRVPVITVAADTPRTDEQLQRVRRHELRHWLLQCSEVDPTGDPEHDGPYWQGLL